MRGANSLSGDENQHERHPRYFDYVTRYLDKYRRLSTVRGS